MTPLRMTEEPDATDADVSAVVDSLRAFNRRHMPKGEPLPLRLMLRDEVGAIRGGLLGFTRWHWLCVEILWVADEHRGFGHGRALLDRAEAIAVARGCSRSRLDTTDFQAQGFYERAGYRVFGTLDDLPPGSRTHWLEKSILPAGIPTDRGPSPGP